MYLLLKMVIFHGHVDFRESKLPGVRVRLLISIFKSSPKIHPVISMVVSGSHKRW